MSGRAKSPQVYRLCAVCGKRHAATFGFRNTLRHLGIDGDKAAPACVEAAMKNADRKAEGRP